MAWAIAAKKFPNLYIAVDKIGNCVIIIQMIIQLNPALPVMTPKGEAYAHFMIDYGMEEHLMFVCFINATGECWTYKNTKIRMLPNITFDRIHNSDIE